MFRRLLTLVSIGFVSVIAGETEKLDNIQKTLDKILSKAGIHFNGEFKSQYHPSKITGDGANDSTHRQVESNEFTSVDFDVTARPNSMVGARVLFRFHQNWQNFFSDVANPLFSRWISIDGNVKDMLFFNVGDFKEKYSPLTLYSPDIEMLNEPYIFARQRHIAMDEMFIGDNNRILQGLNLKFEAEIDPLFNEFHLSLIGTRLRNIETNHANNTLVTPLNQRSEFAKYFIGGNTDMVFLRGIHVGLTELFIFDQKQSFRPQTPTDTLSRDTLAQRTNILSLRPGVDIGTILSSDMFKLKLNAELAVSTDDSTSFDSVGVESVQNAPDRAKKEFVSTKITGTAINLGLDGGVTLNDMVALNVEGSLIMNGKDFRNELAQSPSFVGYRIMNIENNVLDTVNMYNTFDALYNTVFKFCPATESDYYGFVRSPIMKNSYSKSILNQSELSQLSRKSLLDPSLQYIMPFGAATPNRVGADVKLSVELVNKGLRADVQFASLSEKEEVKINSITQPKTTFSKIGGGLKIDVSKIVSSLNYPLEVSGSYVISGAKRPERDTYKAMEFKSAFMNAGLYYKFWKRTALMLGFQSIVNSFPLDTTGTKITFTNWSAGLEWQVAEGADVVGTFGQMSRDNPSDIGDIKQTMADVSLRVKF